MAFQRPSRVRSPSFLSSALSLAKACSIGLRSGLWWQVEQPGLPAFDGLLNAGDLVAGQIVHDDNIARPQRRGEDLFDISPEDVTVHGAIEAIRGGDAGGAQTGDKSGGFPVTVGHRGQQAQTSGASARAPGHVGCCRGLVEEHQALRVESGLAPDEGVGDSVARNRAGP